MVLPYCLVCGLDNAPSFTVGPLNGSVNGGELPPSLADQAKWNLTPKGATVSELMLAVSSRGGANASNVSMRALTFSPDLPIQPKSAGTSQLTGWAFARLPSGEFDGAVFLHLGRNSTTMDLSALIGSVSSASSWELSVMFQPRGEASLLENMSSVVQRVLQLPANGTVDVPAFAIVRLDRAE